MNESKHFIQDLCTPLPQAKSFQLSHWTWASAHAGRPRACHMTHQSPCRNRVCVCVCWLALGIWFTLDIQLYVNRKQLTLNPKQYPSLCNWTSIPLPDFVCVFEGRCHWYSLSTPHAPNVSWSQPVHLKRFLLAVPDFWLLVSVLDRRRPFSRQTLEPWGGSCF